MLLEEENHNFIWLQDKCDGIPGLKLPVAAHLPVIPLPIADNLLPLQELAELMRSLLGCNFMPAMGMLAGLVMGLGYEHIINFYEFCPTVIATGGLSCGKTTSLMTALSTIGCHKSGILVVYLNPDTNMILYLFAYSFIFKKQFGIYFWQVLSANNTNWLG